MRTYTIFLASSYELQPEREKFEIFIGRQNKRLLKKNVQLRLEIWEDMGAQLNESRKQDDYNKILNVADIVVVLFWTKMGKYTREEFELAYQRFLESENRRPMVYVYEKTAPAPDGPQESKKEFIKRLQTEGKEQFHCTFNNYSEFENHFHQTLADLFEKNELTFGKMAERHSLKAPFPPSLVIGRGKELETISEKFKNKGQVILISAEGGMGKTTLASKYWQENRYTYSHCLYLFCEGGILKSMMDDGMGLDLQGLDDGEKIRQLQRKLSGLADDFLLFLDNANDEDEISEFFRVFPGYNWNVLITSRCRDVLPNKADEISLSHLDPEDAKTLFRNFYSEEGDEFENLLNSLLKGMSYHTLLTEVFAKNLKEASEMGTNLKSFLIKLEEKGLVLDSDDNFEVNTGYDESVQKYAATVNDILEILYDFSRLSEEERYLLVNLALLPSDNYSLQFLLDLFVQEDKKAYMSTLKGLFRRGWVGGANQLYRLSPIIKHLVIHRNHETLFKDGFDYLKNLCEVIKNQKDKDNAHTKFQWISFGRELLKFFWNNDEYKFSSFLNYLGILLAKIGGKENLIEAKKLHEKALANTIQVFGKDSPLIVIPSSNLALVLNKLGGVKNQLDAKRHIENALKLNICHFGENSSSVATSRSSLAVILKSMGGKSNLLKAKEHLGKALTSSLNNFGEESRQTANNLGILAIVLDDLGGEKNLKEAKEHLEKAVSLDILSFGEEAPLVATRRSNLAMVLNSLGGKKNLLDAKILLENALASDISNFGEDSHVVAVRRSNLAEILKNQGGEKNLLEAKKNLEKAQASDIQNFGEDSRIVAIHYVRFAMILRDLRGEKNLFKAKNLLEKALDLNIKFLGEDASAVSTVESSIALVLIDLGGKVNLLEAKRYLEKALASYISNFGEDSPAVATCRSNLAAVFSQLGGTVNFRNAKSHLDKALASNIHSFGEHSPAVASVRSNLATVLQALGGKGNLHESKGHLEKALASDIQNFGEDSPTVASRRSNLATVLGDLGGELNLFEARELLEKALASDIRNFGEGSPNTALTTYNLGAVLADIGNQENLRKGKELLERAKNIYLKHFGKDFHMLVSVQGWIDLVEGKLSEMKE